MISDGFPGQVSGPGGVFALPLGGFSLAPIAKPIASRPPPYPPGAVAAPHPHHSLHSLLAHCRHHPYLAGDLKHKKNASNSSYTCIFNDRTIMFALHLTRLIIFFRKRIDLKRDTVNKTGFSEMANVVFSPFFRS